MKELSGWKQLLYITILAIGGVILSNMIAMVVVTGAMVAGNDTPLMSRNVNLVIQFIGQIFIFFIPAYIYLKTQKEPIKEFLNVNKRSKLIIFIYAVALLLLTIPVNDLLMKINQDMVLPASWASLEQWIRTAEAQNMVLVERMLNTTSIFGLFNNLVVIALMASVGEEIIFRGIIQKAFNRVLHNPHVAIVITSILFSAIHAQFYGFLPRLFIGLILGYSYYYTRNLWIPILIHFLNNATSVVLYFLWKRELIDINPLTDILVTPSRVTAVLAVIAIVLVIYRLHKKQQINQP